MYIENLDAITNQVVSNLELFKEVIADYENRDTERKGNYYSCQTCGSKNNLQVFKGNNGIIYYKCHSGCETGTVMQYIMNKQHLESQAEAVLYLDEKYSIGIDIKINNKLNELDLALKKIDRPGYRYDRHHYYRVDGGSIVAAKIIFKDDSNNKQCINVSIKETEERYEYEIGGTHNLLLLYNGHKIKEDTEVLCIVEGEKDADNLGKYGYLAVCPRESQKWVDEYTEKIKHVKQIYIFMDNDHAGERYKQLVVNALIKEWGEYSEEHVLKVINLEYEEEKEDISDIIRRKRESGMEKKQIIDYLKELIKYSENLLSLYQLHQDNEGIFRWVRNKRGKNDVIEKEWYKEKLATFKIIAARQISSIPYKEENKKQSLLELKVQTCIKDNKFYTIKLEPHEMEDRKRFSTILRNEHLTMAVEDIGGSMKDIMKYIIQYKMPMNDCKYYEVTGVHVIDNKPYYITPLGAMDWDGRSSDICKGNNRKENRSRIYQCDQLQQQELTEYLEHAFGFNRKAITIPIMMWTYASFYRWKYLLCDVKSPDIYISGTKGSGKSETEACIIQPHFNNNKKHDPLNITGGTTKLPILFYSSYDNFVPATYNEIGNAERSKKIELFNIIKKRFDNEGTLKGTKTMEIKTYHVEVSPAIYLSEVSFDNEQHAGALNDRIIKCHMITNERTEEHSITYAWFKNNMVIVNKVGKQLLLKTMKQSNEEVMTERAKLEKIILKETQLKDRHVNNVIALLQGYRLLEKVCFDYGLVLSNYLTLEETLKVIEQNMIELNLDGSSKGINHITNSIRCLCNYLVLKEQKGDHVAYKIDENYLCIPTMHYEAARKQLNAKEEDSVLNQTMFSKSVRQEGYVEVDAQGNLPVKKYSDLSGKTSRSYNFKIEDIKHLEPVKDLLVLNGISVSDEKETNKEDKQIGDALPQGFVLVEEGEVRYD